MAEEKEVRIKFTVDTAGSANTLKDVKQAIKDLKDEALSAKFGSEEFKQASSKAAELQDKLEDLGDSMKSLKGTGVEKLNSSMKLLKDGFSNFDGGKISTAFKGIGSAMKSIPIFAIIGAFQFLSDIFVKVAEKLGIVDFIAKKVEQTFYAITDALGLTNKAAEDNANNFVKDQQKKKDASISFYDSEIKAANAAGKNTVELEKKKQKAILDTTIAQLNSLRALGFENLTEEQKKTFKELKITVDNANTELKVIDEKDKKDKADKQAKSNAESIKKQEDHNKKVAALQTEFSLNDRQKLAKTFDDKAKELNKNNANELKIFNEIQEAKNKALKKFDDDKELQERTAAKTLADNITNIKEKYNITQEQLDEKLKNTQLQNTKYTQAEIYQIVVEGLEKESKAKADKKAKDDENEKKRLENAKITSQAILETEKLRNDEIQKNEDLSFQERLDSQISYLEKEKASKIEQAKGNAELIFQINEEYRIKEDEARDKSDEARRKKDIENVKMALDITAQGLQAFGSLSDSIFAIKQSKMKKDSKEYEASQKKQFEVNKKIQIATAIINAAQSITSILGQYPKFDGGVAMTAALITSGIASAAAIAKIASTTYQSTSQPQTPDTGGLDGGGKTPAVNTPLVPQTDLSLFGTAGTRNNKGTQTQIVKAYVVDSEITDAQERQMKRMKNTTL